jgi:hypothetical protein
VSWVLNHSRLERAARMTLICIADLVDERAGYAWVSIPEIARRARISERHAIRGVHSAIAAGELQADRAKDGRGHVTRWWVKKGDLLSPFTAIKDDIPSPFTTTERMTSETRKDDIRDKNGECIYSYDQDKNQVYANARAFASRTRKKDRSKDRDRQTLPALSFWLDQTLIPAYPTHRLGNRDSILKLLRRQNPDEGQRAAVMTQLAAWKAASEWQRDGGQYVPNLETFLSNEKYRHTPPDFRPPKSEKPKTDEEIWH